MRALLILALPAMLMVFPASSHAKPALTLRLSQTSAGSDADDESFLAEISGNGKYVAFMTEATNLDSATDNNSSSDIFYRRTRTSATNRRISVTNMSELGDGDSRTKAVSHTGRYVLINSRATNFGNLNNNGSNNDVFLIDTKSNQIQQASLGADGAGSDAASAGIDVSDNGRYVLFYSDDDDLVPGDNNGYSDVFLRDLSLGTTTGISLTRSSDYPLGNCYALRNAIAPRASARYILYFCEVLTGVGGNNSGEQVVYRYDRRKNITTLVTVNAAGSPFTGEIYNAHMSADGRFVALSTTSALVEADSDVLLDVYVRDIKKQTTRLAVYGLGKQAANAAVDVYDITPDFKYFLIGSRASNLDALGNSGAIAHLFRYDRKRHRSVRVTRATAGASANGDSEWGAISDNGEFVAFESIANNLVSSDANAVYDIFLRRLKSNP